MQQNEISILSTGSLDQPLTEAAAERHISIETIPFIVTKPLESAVLQPILKPLTQQAAYVVFTSTHAVEAVANNLQSLPANWTFFCIGHATRKLVAKQFGDSSIAAVADNGAALAQEIIKYGVAKELVFFCGDHRRNELPDQLRASGTKVREIITYETKLTPQKLSRHYEGILFFSPSAVESFFSANAVSPHTVLFSIGQTTAKALQEHSENKIVVANKPDKADVMKKVFEYFKK
jgi:uroporphyrinogen-III synthase